jgi:hypothetical protein
LAGEDGETEEREEAMSGQTMLNAIIGLAMMVAVTAGYVALARRYGSLWHPVSILFAVLAVSVVVSVLGVVIVGPGWAGVPAMVSRSAIGGFGWGAIIAAVVWASRRLYKLWIARR